MKNYDVVIVGGGISGLYTMYNLRKQYPRLKVLLLEKNNRLGGRIYTYYEKVDGIQYRMDLGAGRLGFSHKLILSLLKNMDLSKDIIPITNDKTYIHIDKDNSKIGSNIQNKAFNIFYKLLNSSKIKNLSREKLQKYYLIDLLNKYLPKSIVKTIQNVFEYTADIEKFNACNAIEYFNNDYHHTAKYFVLKNGIGSIIDNMVKKINLNNYTIKTNCCVKSILYNTSDINYIVDYKHKNNKHTICCKYIVCAIPGIDLVKFKILKPYNNLLNSINNINLTRIFEIYDTNYNNTGKAWFDGMGKMVCNNRIKYIIPINSSNGLIMSSYIDLDNCEYWCKIYKNGKKYLQQILNKNLNIIFRAYNIVVPKSKWVKLYKWDMGVACWKKNVDSHYVGDQILNLMPNFYICGENYSQTQAWCEGALETSEKVLCSLRCKLKKNETYKNKISKNKTSKK